MRSTLDAAEQAALRDALDTYSTVEMTDVLESIAQDYPANPSFNMADWEEMITGILQRKTKSKTTKIFGLSTWWAAASITLFLATSAYFILIKPKKEIATQTTEQHFKNDVAPGGNKAILTLGNGSTIILDSAHTGKLAQQGNAEIVKLDSGKIAYTTTNKKSNEIIYNTLTTPKGGQYQLELPDGSRVWLNAESSLTYPTVFSGSERVVEMTGEAYFEVAHHAKMPFRVKCNGQMIEDIGTSFNVNAYTNEEAMQTTLIEGSVKINNVVLKPGQQAVVTDKISILDHVEVDDIIAWKNGQFRYSSVSIESIMRQAARWYDVDVVYEGKVNETFSGGISRNVNISELLKILGYSNKVSFDIEGKKIIIRPK